MHLSDHKRDYQHGKGGLASLDFHESNIAPDALQLLIEKSIELYRSTVTPKPVRAVPPPKPKPIKQIDPDGWCRVRSMTRKTSSCLYVCCLQILKYMKHIPFSFICPRIIRQWSSNHSMSTRHSVVAGKQSIFEKHEINSSNAAIPQEGKKTKIQSTKSMQSTAAKQQYRQKAKSQSMTNMKSAAAKH